MSRMGEGAVKRMALDCGRELREQGREEGKSQRSSDRHRWTKREETHEKVDEHLTESDRVNLDGRQANLVQTDQRLAKRERQVDGLHLAVFSDVA